MVSYNLKIRKQNQKRNDKSTEIKVSLSIKLVNYPVGMFFTVEIKKLS